jgi:CheY-like chemotaxis protein
MEENEMPSKAKIMVVEDNIDELDLVKMALERDGYEVVAAMNGKKAQEIIGDAKPDFFILDVMMPEMDGFHFCSWLRSNPDYKETPIILLTGVAEHIHDSKYSRDGIMQADADEYLEKPVKLDVLLETVAKLLKK